jgi:hypothetical protein
MNRARRAGIILGSLAAAALTLAAGAPGPSGSTPAWQIVASVHYGQKDNASGYSAVIAVAPADAWAFGGTNPGGASAPEAEHWDGVRWRAGSLPAGLSGFIVAADASSARNVWAVGNGYALRWNGVRWSVAHTWGQAGQVTSVVTISPHDIWVFGSPGFSEETGLGTWHYDGHAWTRATGIAGTVYRASAVSGTDIWAITASPAGGSVVRYDGSDWDAVPAGPALAGTQLDDVLAVSASSAWVSGISPMAGPDGRVVLAHWNGAGWTRFAAPWPVQRAERFAADGAGGIWIPAVTGGGSPEAWLLHLSRSGQWTRTQITASPAGGVGIGDVVLVPGTTSLWGAGGLLTAAGGNAAIWAGGSGDRLVAVRSGSVRSGKACAPERRRPAPRRARPRPAGPRYAADPRSAPGSRPGAA